MTKNGSGTETRVLEEMKGIAVKFYEDLWKKRKYTKEFSARKLKQLLSKVTQKVSTTNRIKGNEQLNVKEFKRVTKMLLTNKSLGIDSIPAEFYQIFDFALDFFQIIEE